MSRTEQLQAAWFEAHQELREFLSQWTYEEQARQIASTACSYWVQRAADGEQPETGPYVALYASAVAVLNQTSFAAATIPLDLAAAAIPTDRTLLPYQLSKIHTDVWMAGQLLSWDRKTIHRLARSLVHVYPAFGGRPVEMVAAFSNKLALPLLRRAVEVLDEHKCLDCKICGESAVRWEDADRRTEEWFTGARLRKERDVCPTQERSPSE